MQIKQNRWSRPLLTPVFFSARWPLGSLLKCSAASTCSADCVLVSQRSLEWAGTEYPPGPEHRVDGWTVLIPWQQWCQLFGVFSFLFYPGPDPLNVSQPGQPLGSVCVGGVGSKLMHQRGHLQGGKSAARTWSAWFSGKEGGSYVCMESHLSDQQGKVPVRDYFCYRRVHQTFKVWKGGERQENKTSRNISHNQRRRRQRLTFAALESHKITFIVERFDNDFYKVKLPLTEERKDTSLALKCRLQEFQTPPCARLCVCVRVCVP